MLTRTLRIESAEETDRRLVRAGERLADDLVAAGVLDRQYRHCREDLRAICEATMRDLVRGGEL